MKHDFAVGISCSASLSSLGSCSNQIKQALTQDTQTLAQRSDLLIDRTAWVGEYQGELTNIVLPEMLQHIDSRNFRFALTALEKMQPNLQQNIEGIELDRLAVVMGTSTSGIADNEPALKAYFAQNDAKVSYQKQEMGCLARGLKTYLGWQGIAYTVSTACSSSGKAFAAGQRLINAGLADAVLVGGVDTLCQLTLNGFASLESLTHDICTPCGIKRDGINIGEAASLFLLTKKPAPIMLMGAGESMDAWHISAPHPEGLGAQQAMQRALDMAQLSSDQIDYLNMHGTATPQNDAMEIKAIRQTFGSDQIYLSSTKHKTGHCLGAAGALEAYICQQILADQSWLPLHQLNEIDPELQDQKYVRQNYQAQPIRYVMSNSFAFGGSNVSLIFGTQS